LYFWGHALLALGIVIIIDGVEAAFVGDMHLLVIADLLAGSIMTQQIEQKIELDIDVLSDRRLLNLKARMPVTDKVRGFFVDVNFNAGLRLVMMARVMVSVVMLGKVKVGHGFSPLRIWLPIAILQ
jgi:hypothetical protein